MESGVTADTKIRCCRACAVDWRGVTTCWACGQEGEPGILASWSNAYIERANDPNRPNDKRVA